MYRLAIRCDVNDYETWRAAHDEFHESAVPADRGVRAHYVFQDETDPNNVSVLLDFDDAETAESYLLDADNKRILEEQGVKPDGILMSVTELES